VARLGGRHTALTQVRAAITAWGILRTLLTTKTDVRATKMITLVHLAILKMLTLGGVDLNRGGPEAGDQFGC
jgi:hypothetical protein